MTCLVQQLFRQKIGMECCQCLMDEVLFPMLRQMKHPPRELLLDIKLTKTCNEIGQSAIVICDAAPHIPESNIHKNISPFAKPPTNRPEASFLGQWENNGRITSKFRRGNQHPARWGSIDILNELRELKQPQIGYHLTYNSQGELKHPQIGYIPVRNTNDQNDRDLEDAFIRLEEKPPWPGAWGLPQEPHVVAQEASIDIEFANDYLEDALNNGKLLSWGGDPERPNSFDSILSTYYY